MGSDSKAAQKAAAAAAKSEKKRVALERKAEHKAACESRKSAVREAAMGGDLGPRVERSSNHGYVCGLLFALLSCVGLFEVGSITEGVLMCVGVGLGFMCMGSAICKGMIATTWFFVLSWMTNFYYVHYQYASRNYREQQVYLPWPKYQNSSWVHWFKDMDKGSYKDWESWLEPSIWMGVSSILAIIGCVVCLGTAIYQFVWIHNDNKKKRQARIRIQPPPQQQQQQVIYVPVMPTQPQYVVYPPVYPDTHTQPQPQPQGQGQPQVHYPPYPHQQQPQAQMPYQEGPQHVHVQVNQPNQVNLPERPENI